jgi:ribosomal protein S2
MKPFISASGTAILIDLSRRCCVAGSDGTSRRTVGSGRQVLFVGTKKKAQEQVRKAPYP